MFFVPVQCTTQPHLGRKRVVRRLSLVHANLPAFCAKLGVVQPYLPDKINVDFDPLYLLIEFKSYSTVHLDSPEISVNFQTNPRRQ